MVVMLQNNKLGHDVIIFSMVWSKFRHSGWIFPAKPIKNMVRNGEMPEFPESTREKAVLATKLVTRLMFARAAATYTIGRVREW